MLKRIAFIINPISGTSDKKELPKFIQDTFVEGWETVIVETQHAGHGSELAKQFSDEKYDVVVACGGDGTMNEVASALVHTDTASCRFFAFFGGTYSERSNKTFA